MNPRELIVMLAAWTALGVPNAAASTEAAVATETPRALQVEVIRPDGTRLEETAPAPKPVTIRARPGKAELARVRHDARAAKRAATYASLRRSTGTVGAPVAEPSPAPSVKQNLEQNPIQNPEPKLTPVAQAPVPSAPASPEPRPPPVASAVPKAAVPPPVALDRRDLKSLAWLARVRAKDPGRYQNELRKNPRARWLVQQAERITAEVEKADVDDRRTEMAEERHGAANRRFAIEPRHEEDEDKDGEKGEDVDTPPPPVAREEPPPPRREAMRTEDEEDEDDARRAPPREHARRHDDEDDE